MAEREIERRDVGDHRSLRLQCLPQRPDLGLQLAAGRLHGGERDCAFLRDRPDEARVAAEVERQERLARRQRRLDLLDGRRFRIDQVGVGGKAPRDLLLRLGAFGAIPVDRGIDRPHAGLVTLARRQRQHVVERAELRVDLLRKVLLLAHQLRERGVLRDHAGAGRRERLLHRAAANRVREDEGLGRDIPAGLRHLRDQLHIGLDDVLQPLLARGDHGRVVVVGILARGRHHDRDGGTEFPHRLGIAAGAHVTDRERAARGGRVEMLLADAADFALEQRLRRGEARLDLTARIKGIDARAVELEHLAALRLPLRNGLVELGINRGRLLRLALQVENAAELRKDLRAGLGVVADAERALHVERRADQLLRLSVAALLHQDGGEADDETGRQRIVFAPALEHVEQGAPRVGLGFAQAALAGLDPPQAGKIAGGGRDDLPGRRRKFISLEVGERCPAKGLAALISGFGLLELATRLEDQCTAFVRVGLPGAAVDLVAPSPVRVRAAACVLHQRRVAADIGLRLADIAHQDQSHRDAALGIDQCAAVARLVAFADGHLERLHRLFRIAERVVLVADELANAGLLPKLAALRDLQRLFAVGQGFAGPSQRGAGIATVVVELCQRGFRQLLARLGLGVGLELPDPGRVGLFLVEDRRDVGDRARRRHEDGGRGLARGRFLLRDGRGGGRLACRDLRHFFLHTGPHGRSRLGAASLQVAGALWLGLHAGLHDRLAHRLAAGLLDLLEGGGGGRRTAAERGGDG